jgi:hypothetical protein
MGLNERPGRDGGHSDHGRAKLGIGQRFSADPLDPEASGPFTRTSLRTPSSRGWDGASRLGLVPGTARKLRQLFLPRLGDSRRPGFRLNAFRFRQAAQPGPGRSHVIPGIWLLQLIGPLARAQNGHSSNIFNATIKCHLTFFGHLPSKSVPSAPERGANCIDILVCSGCGPARLVSLEIHSEIARGRYRSQNEGIHPPGSRP